MLDHIPQSWMDLTSDGKKYIVTDCLHVVNKSIIGLYSMHIIPSWYTDIVYIKVCRSIYHRLYIPAGSLRLVNLAIYLMLTLREQYIYSKIKTRGSSVGTYKD